MPEATTDSDSDHDVLLSIKRFKFGGAAESLTSLPGRPRSRPDRPVGRAGRPRGGHRFRRLSRDSRLGSATLAGKQWKPGASVADTALSESMSVATMNWDAHMPVTGMCAVRLAR